MLKEERRIEIRKKITYFVLLMKSHLQSYPCPLQINYFWNWGFLLGITIILYHGLAQENESNKY